LTLIPGRAKTQFDLPTEQRSMSQRNGLTMPITVIDKMTALMTMRSALRTMGLSKNNLYKFHVDGRMV
jgi:hypothetical protein